MPHLHVSTLDTFLPPHTVLPSLISSPATKMLDLGSDAYLWRIKDQFLGARFTECYAGPEFLALGAGEQRRRVQLYEKRRWDEYWYLWRAWGRRVRWEVRAWLGLTPY